jgi:hypothetical protein
MLDPSKTQHLMWATLQEPRSPAYVPNSYLLLLSALEKGWRVERTDMVPSWDQHGFVYLVTLRRGTPEYTQRLILPKSAVIEELLAEMSVA